MPDTRLLLVFGLCLCLAGCAGKRLSSADDLALLRPDGARAGEAEFLRLAERADYILIGEQHDNPRHHLAQARLLELAPKSALAGLEMLPYTARPALERFNSGHLQTERLPEALDWRRVWGFDFALYRPIFEVARERGLPVYGLNIPNDLRRKARDQGLAGLAPAERAELPPEVIAPLPEQREALKAFFETHGAAMRSGRAAPPAVPPAEPSAAPLSTPSAPPAVSRKNAKRKAPALSEAALERFLFVQSLWDSTMAWQAQKILGQERARGRQGPLLIFAGGGHVERGWGIAHRLRLLQPEARVLVVMPTDKRPPATAADADLFYFCPPAGPKAPAVSGRSGRPALGLTLDGRDGGLRVRAVTPGSRAAGIGLRPDDILAAANGTPLRLPADLHAAAMKARQRGEPLRLTVERNGERLEVEIPPAEPKP